MIDVEGTEITFLVAACQNYFKNVSLEYQAIISTDSRLKSICLHPKAETLDNFRTA